MSLSLVTLLAQILPIIISAATLFYVVKDVRQGRSSFEAQLRSYIKIVGKSVPYPDVLAEHGGQAFISVENYGQTPAFDVAIYSMSFIADMPLPVGVLEAGKWSQLGSGVITHPGVPADFGVGIAPLNQTAMALTNAGRAIYVLTRVRYQDVFGQRHMEQTCLRIDYRAACNARFEHVDRYNEST